MTIQIDEEAASAMVIEGFRARRLTCDIDALSASQKPVFEAALKRTALAVVAGSVVIDENGFTFTPQFSKNKDPIVYGEPTAETYMKGDGLVGATRTVEMTAQLAKHPAKLIAALHKNDFEVVNALLQLFLV